ncbi:MAG: CorA family divalent cation transporter [Gaiellaceae bacterium]
MLTAVVFDRHEVETVRDWRSRLGKLRASSLLWIDIDDPSAMAAAELRDALALTPESEGRLESPTGESFFKDFGSYMHLTTLAPRAKDGPEATDISTIECLVGENWIVTAHDQPAEVLEEFAKLAGGSGDVGALDGPTFLATLLEWVLHEYAVAFETIETQLEAFDVRAMKSTQMSAEDGIARLVDLRSDIGSLHRSLMTHRRPLAALGHAELGALSSEESAERFTGLLVQFESTVNAARDARESVVGSFDVLLARTGQRTNEIVKVLTLTSVILLPGTAIAGIMGMNFNVGLFTHPALFWVVVGAVGLIAAMTLSVAKLRHWL